MYTGRNILSNSLCIREGTFFQIHGTFFKYDAIGAATIYEHGQNSKLKKCWWHWLLRNQLKVEFYTAIFYCMYWCTVDFHTHNFYLFIIYRVKNCTLCTGGTKGGWRWMTVLTKMALGRIIQEKFWQFCTNEDMQSWIIRIQMSSHRQVVQGVKFHADYFLIFNAHIYVISGQHIGVHLGNVLPCAF